MDQINEIKQRIDVVDLIGQYVTLTKAGRNYKGLCPFHNEKTPSFMVSQELQIFRCFGCGASGDIFKFIQTIEGVDFPESLRQLAEKAGVKLESSGYSKEEQLKKIYYEINHLAVLYYQYLLWKHPIGKPAMKYLKEKRKLTDKTIKDFMIGYAPNTWDALYKTLTKKGYKPEDIATAGLISPGRKDNGYYDKFRGRIIFPFIDINGKIIGLTGRTIINKEPKYLNTQETPIFHKNSFVFCLDKAKVAIKKEGVIFVEGQMDAIAAHQFGFTNVVASGGTSLTTNQLKIIKRYTQDLLLCFDSDTAGSSAMQRGIELAEKENFNIKVIMIPTPYKDLDELLQADKEQATSIISNPVPVYDFYLASAFKRNDKSTAIGKKKIMEDLARQFLGVNNKVIIDHYTKRIAEELDINEETVKTVLSSREKQAENTKDTIKEKVIEEQTADIVLSKTSPQEYMLALLLKTPLDIAQTILYKLGQKDFPNPTIQEIFVLFKDYLLGRKQRFKIEYFNNKLNEEQKQVVTDLYMWDLVDVTEDPKKFENELENTFERIKKESARRELKELSLKIKQAELEKNIKLVKELSEKVKALSGRLV